MGYEITCVESSFRVTKPVSALAALKAANRRRALFDFEDIPVQVEKARTLAGALTACCWDVEKGADGRIAQLFYEGKLLTTIDDVERLFDVLAPFMRSGSYLLLEGEDGT